MVSIRNLLSIIKNLYVNQIQEDLSMCNAYCIPPKKKHLEYCAAVIHVLMAVCAKMQPTGNQSRW